MGYMQAIRMKLIAYGINYRVILHISMQYMRTSTEKSYFSLVNKFPEYTITKVQINERMMMKQMMAKRECCNHTRCHIVHIFIIVII